MSYTIRCWNCYFNMYLLEINQRPKLMDFEKTGLIDIIRIRHRRTEWKTKNNLGKWFLTDGEIIFNSWFGCIYQVLENWTYRKNSPHLEVLKKSMLRSSFGQGLVWILTTIILIEICIFILLRFAISIKSTFVFMLSITILISLIVHSL